MNNRIKRIRKILLGITCEILIILMLFPIYWIITTATKPVSEAFALPPKFIYIPEAESFLNVINRSNFLSSYLNTLIVAAITVTLVLIFGITSGYSLARNKTRSSKAMGMWIMLARMIPPIGFVIPFYTLFRRIGLNDNYLAISLVYMTIVLPFTTWLMIGFIKGVPVEIEKAAMIDGCSRIQTLIHVVIPCSKPGIATCAIFAFMLSWNEFFYAMIMTGRNTKVVSVALQGFITTTGTEWSKLCAAAVLVVLPILIFTAFAQKSLVRGIMSGAVKG